MNEISQKQSSIRSKRITEDDEDTPNLPDETAFKNSLKLFQNLVDRTVVQKREERLGLYVKDEEEMDYDKFYAAVQDLFGTGVRAQDVKTFYRKISNNPDGRTEWCEIFGYYITEGDGLGSQYDEENMVFLLSKKQRISKTGVKRRDVIKCIVKMPQLDFMVTASQKGILSIFSSEMRVLATTSISESSWITGCDYLSQLKCVAAITERTIIVWDYKTPGTAMDSCIIIKPMDHCLLSIASVPRQAEILVKDDILLGDDAGYVNLFTMTSDDFGLKQSKVKKQKQIMVIDTKKFKNIKRKLHNDWVVRIKYIPALNCFGSCSLDSVHSLVLDDLKRLEDNIPVRDFSVPRGVNAFTYCGKANIIVTGGDDKVLRLWHPNINTKPVGKLLGHLFSIREIVTNEKDQHIISLSTAKIFKVWDIQTLSLLQVFHDFQGGPKDTQVHAMVFDNHHGTLIAGSAVIDIYPLTRMIQDTKQVPQTHERSINVMVYNRIFHQLLTICSESIIKVWELETGQLIYQIEDAHGPSVELTCAAIDKSGFRLATGACDGTVKTWDFGSGQGHKMLPLPKESKDNEHWLIQMVYLKATESKHVILVLEYSGAIKIVQGSDGDLFLSITWELPSAMSLALQGNPLIPLKLSPNAKKNNGFYPDVELLPDKAPLTPNPEFRSRIEVSCFDILRVEGYNLLATASANGAIMMWDFESATTTYMFKAGHAVQIDGPELLKINRLLFLYRTPLSDRQLSLSSTFTSDPQSDESHTLEEGSTVCIKMEGDKSDHVVTSSTTGLGSGSVIMENKEVAPNFLVTGVQSTEPQNIPILAVAHEDGRIYLWTTVGELLRELLPFTKHPPIPVTSLSTSTSHKMLFAANREGHVIRWSVGSFLENPCDVNKHLKQQICWRAHSTKIVELFYDEEKNLVVTASVDCSVRLWQALSGYYLGYFGQRRMFEISGPTDIILPCDVNQAPFTIKEDNKYLDSKQKFEYPLVLDRKRWKTLTRSSLSLKKPGPSQVDQDFKFFKALASPKINKETLESFKSGNKDAGIVFGAIPIYKIISPPITKASSEKEASVSVDNLRKQSKLIHMTPKHLSSQRAGHPSQAPMTPPSPAAQSVDMKIRKESGVSK